MRPTKPNTRHSWNNKNPKTRKYSKSSLPNKNPSQGRKKQFKAKPLPHKLIDELLLEFEKKNRHHYKLQTLHFTRSSNSLKTWQNHTHSCCNTSKSHFVKQFTTMYILINHIFTYCPNWRERSRKPSRKMASGSRDASTRKKTKRTFGGSIRRINSPRQRWKKS